MRITTACFAIFIITLAIVSPCRAQLTWFKSSDNPVLPYWSGNVNDPNGYKYAQEPTVIYDSVKGIFRMWFVSEPFTYGARFCASNAISFDGIRWYTDIKNPAVFTGGDLAFDMNIRIPRVITDGTGYKMYFMGENNNNTSIGLATSPDGVTWQKYSGNPVLTNGSPGSWDAIGGMFEDVLHKDSLNYMWYSGSDGSGHDAIGLATSSDGIHWIKYSGNPVMQKGANGWNSVSISSPSVVFVNGLFYMFYLGTSASVCCQSSVGLAYSSDGITWTQSPSNPILSPSSGWEDQSMGGLCAMVHNNKFYLYYTAQNSQTLHWQIGLESADITSLGVGKTGVTVPRKSSLSQSYPNPFNPVARIHYELSREGPVSLKIYDLLGREVATLVNERKTAGRYDAEWNAASFPSGTYIYKIIAGDFVDSRKMILIK